MRDRTRSPIDDFSSKSEAPVNAPSVQFPKKLEHFLTTTRGPSCKRSCQDSPRAVTRESDQARFGYLDSARYSRRLVLSLDLAYLKRNILSRQSFPREGEAI